MKNFLLSCDWGTSSFRLKLIHTDTHTTVAEVCSNTDGIAAVYQDWKRRSGQEKTERETFYLGTLKSKIELLAKKASTPLEGVPVVISGMAGSSIGMKEIPYASLPFALDGSSAKMHTLPVTSNFPYQLMLISGLCGENEVMRGEETQMIGLSSVDRRTLDKDGSTWIFPGTHSKHIEIAKGEIVTFRTYITGELFNLLHNYSILNECVFPPVDEEELDPVNHRAFCKGVNRSGESTLLNTLFSVRTNYLFQYLSSRENFFYLSGLLIGTELKALLKKDGPFILCSDARLFSLYCLAFKELNLFDQLLVIPPEVVANAASEGHLKVFRNKRK